MHPSHPVLPMLWDPGYFRHDLKKSRHFHRHDLVCSAEPPWEGHTFAPFYRWGNKKTLGFFNITQAERKMLGCKSHVLRFQARVLSATAGCSFALSFLHSFIPSPFIPLIPSFTHLYSPPPNCYSSWPSESFIYYYLLLLPEKTWDTAMFFFPADLPAFYPSPEQQAAGPRASVGHSPDHSMFHSDCSPCPACAPLPHNATKSFVKEKLKPPKNIAQGMVFLVGAWDKEWERK